MTHGQRCYERFMKSLFGEPPQPWEMLEPHFKEAWEVASGTDHDKISEVLSEFDDIHIHPRSIIAGSMNFAFTKLGTLIGFFVEGKDDD